MQKGHFVALKWSDPEEGVTSLKVGIVPSSIGADLVECIDDADRNGVFRVVNPQTQRIKIVQSDGVNQNVQILSLEGLKLTPDTGV